MTAPSLLAVFVGGGAGAVCRYAVGLLVGRWYTGEVPLGTMAINVSGCFALGVVASLLAGRPGSGVLFALLATGFLGGYTTFSTYALEGVVLYGRGLSRVAWVSMLTPVVVGILAAGLGALLVNTVRGV